MTLDEHYICQRAANAIISEIGPFRVSTDALQSINQFLDEFIVLLLTCSLSLDLSQIKSIVVSLLPSTLGKNAIVEAELEVKTFTETESIDYELYERMRNLGEGKNERFPLDEAVTLLREKCFEYCTLADKDDQLYLQKSLRNNKKRNESTMKVVISPIVAIYVTTIMEHIAEYLLTAVAMTAEHEDTDYVRVKEVFLALNDDIQLGDVFNRMDLKDKMEKRAGIFDYNKVRMSYLPTSRPQSPQIPTLNLRNNTTENSKNETGSFLDISFDDLDLDYFDDNPRKSTVSTTILPDRPHSAMSHIPQQQTLSNRKSTFHLFKHNRNSFSGDVLQPRAPTAEEDNDSDLPVMNFDELIKSGGTVKVSLTPNRLRSIEIKDPKKEDLAPPQPTWERRSTSSPRLSTVSRPSSPLVRQKSTTSTRTTTSSTSKKVTPLSSLSLNAPSTTSVSSRNSTTTTTDSEPQKVLPEVPKLNARPQTPSSPLSKSTFSGTNRFENPREAPKPPSTPSSFTTPTKNVTPLSKLPTSISSIHNSSSDSIPSSTHSMPSPILSTTTSSIHKTSSISIQEPPIPRPTKSNTMNTNGMLIRRSSGSSKKSRDNLRKLKEQENQQKDEQQQQKELEQEKDRELQREQEQQLQREQQLQKERLQKEQQQREQLQKEEEEQQREQLRKEQLQKEQLQKEQLQREQLQREQQMQKEQQEELLRKQDADYEPTPTAIVASTDLVLTEEPEQMEARQVHFEDNNKPTTPPVSTSSSSESVSEIDTISNHSSDSIIKETTVIPRKTKAQTLSPERPSSMVAKRASMISNNRRRSLHETYATDILRQRSGSVSVSIKQWDDLNNNNSEAEQQPRTVIPPVSHRRSVLRQLRQQQLVEEQQQLKEQYQQQQEQEDLQRQKTYAVLDKVLKFESSIADHQRVSHMPRRERFLYLQQDPSAIERKSITRKTIVKPIIRRVEGVDQGVQTDPIIETVTTTDDTSSESESEHGEVDGDEEWFLQDSEWDEQEETAIVEWLLGE